MTDAQDPRIGRPVTRNVQVDGTWYRHGDLPSAAHALRITDRRVWGDEMGESDGVPGPSQFGTDGDGNVVPPAGQPVTERPEQPVPSTEESVTEPAPDSIGEGPFDPREHTVAEVQEYLAGVTDEQERQRVVDVERSGKGRTGIVGA